MVGTGCLLTISTISTFMIVTMDNLRSNQTGSSLGCLIRVFTCLTTYIEHPYCQQHVMRHLICASHIHTFPEDKKILCFFQKQFWVEFFKSLCGFHFFSQKLPELFCTPTKMWQIFRTPTNLSKKYFVPLHILLGPYTRYEKGMVP